MSLQLQHSVVIFVAHGSDPMAELAIDLLGRGARMLATDGFLYCHSDDPLHGWRSDSESSAVRCSIFDELSSNRRLTRIRVVSVATTAEGGNEAEVADCARTLIAMLAQNRGHNMKIDDVSL